MEANTTFRADIGARATAESGCSCAHDRDMDARASCLICDELSSNMVVFGDHDHGHAVSYAGCEPSVPHDPPC